MALVFGLEAGYVFNEVSDTLTAAKLNRMFSEGRAVLLSGQVTAGDIKDGEITAAKLATTLDLSSKTLTLPVKEDTEANISDGSTVTPDSKGQAAIASDTGAIFIAKGTAATDWVYSGHVNDDSISSTPNYVGQTAYVSNVLYVASGTSSSSDWTAVTAMNSATDPDWDSGWTSVVNNLGYDLTSSSTFSDTTKNTSGQTPASGTLTLTITQNNPGYRNIIVMFKPTSSDNDYVLTHGTNIGTDNSGNRSGWLIESDEANDKLYMRTGNTHVFNYHFGSAASPLKTDWGASGTVTYTSGLMRIMIWI